MNGSSPLLLIGIGTSGAAIARGVYHAFGEGLRYVTADTDASTGKDGEPFLLLGGNRLSGRGTGGDIVAGRLAAEDSIKEFDARLTDVRVAVVVTSLGGGTGGGATLEAVKFLAERGIPTVVFATLPFAFEGEDRQRNARGIMTMIEDAANTTFFLELDKLVTDTDTMDNALRRAQETVVDGITLFWRLLEKPGYIRMDAERLRHLLSVAGRGRFASVVAQGPDRAGQTIERLVHSEALSTASGTVRSALCGILAGSDLLLSEVGAIADGVHNIFGGQTFDLGTVNDDATFSGRIATVVMLFEANTKTEVSDSPVNVIGGRRRKPKGPLGPRPNGRDRRFKNAEPTIWNNEDLDVPTFIRRNISIDL